MNIELDKDKIKHYKYFQTNVIIVVLNMKLINL